MVDPFAAAASVLFSGPGSVAAIYQPIDGAPVAIRIIRGKPDDVSPFGGGAIVQATNLLQLLRSQVPNPQAGDQLTIDGATLVITGVPVLDVERVTWDCAAEPA